VAEAPAAPGSCAAFEMWLARDLTDELLHLARQLAGPAAALVEWLAMAAEVEDLKTRVRAGAAALKDEQVLPHLFMVPASSDASIGPFEPDAPGGSRSERNLSFALRPQPMKPLPREEECFAGVRQEWALERAYLLELLGRTGKLDRDDQELVVPLVRQEIELFHLRVAFGVPQRENGLTGADWREGLHIPGAWLGQDEFVELLHGGVAGVPECRGLRRVLGPAMDGTQPNLSAAASPEPADFERRAWRWLRRLACRAFRRDPMGLGALVGYVYLRRIAVAEIGQLAEGMRLGLSLSERRGRLLHADTGEMGHV